MATQSTTWLAERTRTGLSTVVGVAVALGFAFGFPAARSASDVFVIGVVGYLAAYLTVTAVAFSRASDATIESWAHRESRGTWLQRYVLGTAPGPGVAVIIATAMLPVALFWLPGNASSQFAPDVRLGIGALLLITAWSSVLVAFSLTFLADNIVEGEKALDFPGGNPGWASYVYFSVGVMATFGATDVTVMSERMRITVTVNAIVAFVFNTVIVAAAVAAISAG